MYKILLPLDSDKERAKLTAETVLDFPGDPKDLDVHILNVFKKVDVVSDAKYSNEDSYDETEFPDSVSLAEQILTDENVTVSLRREMGTPAEKIVSVADEIDADVIAMSGRKQSPTGKVIFGSVSQSVLLSADRPVHLVMND
jgi:nucleotide-binding universal stress UspA family protein